MPPAEDGEETKKARGCRMGRERIRSRPNACLGEQRSSVVHLFPNEEFPRFSPRATFVTSSLCNFILPMRSLVFVALAYSVATHLYNEGAFRAGFDSADEGTFCFRFGTRRGVLTLTAARTDHFSNRRQSCVCVKQMNGRNVGSVVRM